MMEYFFGKKSFTIIFIVFVKYFLPISESCSPKDAIFDLNTFAKLNGK